MQDLGVGDAVVKSAIATRTMTLSINQWLLITSALAVLYSRDVSVKLRPVLYAHSQGNRVSGNGPV